jgi:hypothetical protein
MPRCWGVSLSTKWAMTVPLSHWYHRQFQNSRLRPLVLLSHWKAQLYWHSWCRKLETACLNQLVDNHIAFTEINQLIQKLSMANWFCWGLQQNGRNKVHEKWRYHLLGPLRWQACLFAEPISSTLKMEAICCSETSVETQRTTRSHIPEDDTLHNHHCENLKYYIHEKWLHNHKYKTYADTINELIFLNNWFVYQF